ncbi:MAG: hypothetical protein ACJ75K_01190, partial [Actinomycetes bacterium]
APKRREYASAGLDFKPVGPVETDREPGYSSTRPPGRGRSRGRAECGVYTCSTGGIEMAIEQATAAAGEKDAVAHQRLCVKR